MNSPPRAVNSVETRLCIPAAHPALPGHFPGHPIVPGVLLLDEVREVVESAFGRRVRCVAQVKFTEVLTPGEPAWMQAWMEGGRVCFHVKADRAGNPVPLAQGSLLLACAGAA